MYPLSLIILGRWVPLWQLIRSSLPRVVGSVTQGVFKGLCVHRLISLKLYECGMIVDQTLDLVDFVHRLVGWL